LKPSPKDSKAWPPLGDMAIMKQHVESGSCMMLFTCIAVVIPESCGETKHATDRLRENIT
jgi:hypothetical protein